MNITTRDLPAAGCLDLTRKEAARYSLVELIDAAAVEDRSKLQFYRECSDAIAARLGPASTGFSFYLPTDVMTRDLTAANASGGGYLVGQEMSFASGLFGANLLSALPMRTLPLTGNGVMAAMTPATTQWLGGEAAESSTADPTFGQRAVDPKTVIVTFFKSRQLHLQAGPSGQSFIEQQIGAKLGEAAGIALVNGSGVSGQPVGLLKAVGTTSTSGSSLAWSGVSDLIAASEGYTASGLIFVLGVTAAKLLRQREKASGNGMVYADGKIDGIPVIVSRCAPADSLLLAPWPTVVFATWGAPELTVTPLASSSAFQTGKIGVRLAWSVDFIADQASAVGKSESIT